MTTPSAPVMTDLIDEHFEELEFLWELRERQLYAPDWNLNDLEDLETRAMAHADGLRLAGNYGDELALGFLREGDQSEVCAATLALGDRFPSAVMEAFVSAQESTLLGICTGLRHLPYLGQLQPLLQAQTMGRASLTRAVILNVLASHQVLAQAPSPQTYATKGPLAHRLALDSFARNRQLPDASWIAQALAVPEPEVHLAALHSAAQGGLTSLLMLSRQYSDTDIAGREAALSFRGVIGDESDLRPMLRAMQHSTLARAAIEGLGALGHPQSIPGLLEAMTHPELALDAGRAFSRITGIVDIEGQRVTEPPADLDEDELEFWEAEALPDPRQAHAAWLDFQKEMEPGLAYQVGRPRQTIDLIDGQVPLAIRRDVYLRRCLYQTSTQLDTSAMVFRQKRMLAKDS